MRLTLYYLKGKSEEWAERACEEYVRKLKFFVQFDRVAIKSKNRDRENQAEKVKAESEALMQKLSPRDFVILFDEKGRVFSDSVEFSKNLVKAFEKSSSHIVFVIGGPYGFSEEIKSRANLSWSLGPLTMNHHVAHIVALEQVYRALTIWKGIPYHNI